MSQQMTRQHDGKFFRLTFRPAAQWDVRFVIDTGGPRRVSLPDTVRIATGTAHVPAEAVMDQETKGRIARASLVSLALLGAAGSLPDIKDVKANCYDCYYIPFFNDCHDWMGSSSCLCCTP